MHNLWIDLSKYEFAKEEWDKLKSLLNLKPVHVPLITEEIKPIVPMATSITLPFCENYSGFKHE